MSPFRTLGRIAVIPVLGATIYAVTIHGEVSGLPSDLVSVTDAIPQGFRNSKTLRALVNPRHFTATEDAYTTTIDVPARHNDVSDETILACYLRGFFASRVFAPERVLLKCLRPRGITSFSRLQAFPSSASDIWTVEELPKQTTPALHSMIFGIFQILDIQVSQTKDEIRESFIDVGFGSDTGRFSGCHRLSIERMGDLLHIQLCCTTCNPSSDKGFRYGFLTSFHKIYAMLLFRAAATRVKHQLDLL